MNVGFIGLGNMGRAIAGNLLKAGHKVTVWNRTPNKGDELVAQGARRADTPKDAAGGEVVMTMLADDKALEAVVYGPDGIAGAPALHVGHSTISPTLADRLAGDKPDGYLSAPVFGRPDMAAAAKLFVIAGGPSALIDRAQPLLDAVGQQTFRVGDKPSAANIVKLSGNFMIMAAVESLAEAMALAEKNGIERKTLFEVLTGTLFSAPVYKNYGGLLVEEKFKPAGFAAPLGLKDILLAQAAAGAARVPMPVLGVVRDQLIAAIAQGGEDIDWAGIGISVRKASGLD